MKLTLALPGLTWLDHYDGAEVCKGLQLPTLQHLLGRARCTPQATSLSAMLGSLFGQPWQGMAALAAQQANLDFGNGHWLIADPVHVRIDRGRALLADIGVMALSQQEAEQLTATLNQHFADDGLYFVAPSPGRWFVQCQHASQARFTPLVDAVGENVNDHLPQGEHGLEWSRLLNEMQMLLYTHPVNDQREARGELPVNSVWLWGEGDFTPPVTRYDRVLADDANLHLLAATSQAAVEAAPHAYTGLAEILAEHPQEQNLLLVLDALQAPAQYRDAWGWRETLTRLESDWFAPLQQALIRGQLTELTLHCHGPAGFKATLTPSLRWKFWQRPIALATLY